MQQTTTRAKSWQVYLWRFRFEPTGLVVWKIGLTGMSLEKRKSAWSGWLGLANLLSVQAARSVLSRVEQADRLSVERGWVVELVSASPEMDRRQEALALERGLHSRYAHVALGNEMFSTHPDFTPQLLSCEASRQTSFF